jgi:L-2-hydroxycarboxylate dehydrogenase (NAD+)
MNFVIPVDTHDRIISSAYRKRGFTPDECDAGVRIGRLAAWHGIKTHNAIKALHLDDDIGSGNKTFPGCTPGAVIEKKSKFEAAQQWNANRKLGAAVAYEAMDTAMQLAERFGVATIAVDDAYHYLWGGGYVMEAAQKGYIAYTNCTSGRAEVIPFQGRAATLGTNPHSWALPTTYAVGFPIVMDWATSIIAFGKVQSLAREGKSLPPGVAVDKDGDPTTDPNKAAHLLPFGAHKGYGLALLNELFAAFTGGAIPTRRGRMPTDDGEKTTCNLFFLVIHPEALNCDAFCCGRDQKENVRAVLKDVLGHGNESCLLPGQVEAEAARDSEAAGGLIFTPAEIEVLKHVAADCGAEFDAASLKRIE